MTEETRHHVWPLQDAKARFSEVVRRAREDGPQHVTIRGRDAVVVLASAQFARLSQPGTGAALVLAMADPRLRGLDFDPPKTTPRVRDVEL